MITDDELLTEIAKIVGVTKEKIKSEVNYHKANGIAKLFAKTKPFWIKSRGELDLSAGDYLINLKEYFPDIWQLRHIRSEYGRLQIMSEGRFIKQFEDDTVTGTPNICIPLDADYIQLYPRLDADLTHYASYFYSPDRTTITSVKEEWQFVVRDYVLAMMTPDKEQMVALLGYFQKGLESVMVMAKPITDDSIDIESNSIVATMSDIQLEER
jgi:hypothetical protein